MPRIPEIIPATVVHEVMDPSEMVRKLIAQLLEEPEKASRVSLHTSVQRVIDRRKINAHPRSEYAREFRQAEVFLANVGRTALLLGDGTELRRASDGSERLIFHPRHQAQLDLFTSAMDDLPSMVEQNSTEGHLYVQFAAGSLTRDIGRRRDVLSLIDARSRHPGTKPHMKADNPRIVMRDGAVRRPAA